MCAVNIYIKHNHWFRQFGKFWRSELAVKLHTNIDPWVEKNVAVSEGRGRRYYKRLKPDWSCRPMKGCGDQKKIFWVKHGQRWPLLRLPSSMLRSQMKKTLCLAKINKKMFRSIPTIHHGKFQQKMIDFWVYPQG